jgi:hypothetical protein
MSQKPKAGRGKKAAGKKRLAQTQAERFIEAARSVGVDESGKEFERAIKKIVPSKSGKKG